MNNDKYYSFWPLPGGADGHTDSLIKIMAYVNSNQPNTQQLKKFFFDTFPTVGSEKVVNSYLNTVIKRLDYFSVSKDAFSLSDEGKKYLENPDDELLFNQLDKKIIGFKEILFILSKRPLGIEDLHKELLLTLGNNIEWDSSRQTLVRARWLQSMKFISKPNGLYTLTEPGKTLVQKFGQQAPITIERTNINYPPAKKQDDKKDIKTMDSLCIINELEESQHDATNPERYEIAITEAFRYIGFSTDHLGKAGRTDVLSTAHLGEDMEYSMVIDGKSTASEKIPERQISWDSINEHREENNAIYAVVVAPGFSGGDLIDRAKKHNVLLIDTKSLIEVIKLHTQSPLNLADYRELFAQSGLFNINNCDKLLKKFDKIKRQNDLISKILVQLKKLHVEDESTTINDLYWSMDKVFGKEEIIESLKILETLNMVMIFNGQYIAVMNPSAAAHRFTILSNLIKS